uniref:Uncharacterized protein n=1 Tax=Mycena chlorophos TaxID=658473 RepID=A0ABQ0LX63_MYCCL|nr:predicted protein [Mycena chlorophos]
MTLFRVLPQRQHDDVVVIPAKDRRVPQRTHSSSPKLRLRCVGKATDAFAKDWAGGICYKLSASKDDGGWFPSQVSLYEAWPSPPPGLSTPNHIRPPAHPSLRAHHTASPCVLVCEAPLDPHGRLALAD